jgi:hypothetical protein
LQSREGRIGLDEESDPDDLNRAWIRGVQLIRSGEHRGSSVMPASQTTAPRYTHFDAMKILNFTAFKARTALR